MELKLYVICAGVGPGVLGGTASPGYTPARVNDGGGSWFLWLQDATICPLT